MPFVTIQDVACTLDNTRNEYRELLEYLTRHTNSVQPMLFAMRGNDLTEVMLDLQKQFRNPVVDLHTGIVFGPAIGHEMLMKHLLWYHLDEHPANMWDPAGLYLLDGYGYYVSSQAPDMIVLSRRYRADMHDRFLFPHYQLDYID